MNRVKITRIIPFIFFNITIFGIIGCFIYLMKMSEYSTDKCIEDSKYIDHIVSFSGLISYPQFDGEMYYNQIYFSYLTSSNCIMLFSKAANINDTIELCSYNGDQCVQCSGISCGSGYFAGAIILIVLGPLFLGICILTCSPRRNDNTSLSSSSHDLSVTGRRDFLKIENNKPANVTIVIETV